MVAISGGAIAGIVCGTIGGVTIVAIAIYFLVKKVKDMRANTGVYNPPKLEKQNQPSNFNDILKNPAPERLIWCRRRWEFRDFCCHIRRAVVHLRSLSKHAYQWNSIFVRTFGFAQNFHLWFLPLCLRGFSIFLRTIEWWRTFLFAIGFFYI